MAIPPVPPTFNDIHQQRQSAILEAARLSGMPMNPIDHSVYGFQVRSDRYPVPSNEIEHPRMNMDNAVNFTIIAVENGYVVELREPITSVGEVQRKTTFIVTDRENLGEALQAQLARSSLLKGR